MLLQRTARFSTGNLPLLDGTLISSGQSSPHHASTPLSVNGVDGLIRSKSLNQFVVRRRQSAEIRRQRELQRRPRTFSKRLKFLALFFALPAMLIGCTLWQFPSAIAELFGASDASRGSSRVSSVSSTAVSDAFSASSSKLEALRFDAHDGMSVLPLLDALDALQPAYEALGVMFAVASQEITANSKKLRVVFEELQQKSQVGCTGPAANDQCTPLLAMGRGVNFATANSLQDVILAVAPEAPAYPAMPAAEAVVAAARRSLSARGGNSANGNHRATMALSVSPKDAYEAGQWLFFSLHMMELLYGCVGNGQAPGHCATLAYNEALKPHQNFAMRAIAGGVLRLVPNSSEGLRERAGMETDAAAFNAMMTRWSAAVSKPRRVLEAFYAQWPEHKG